MSSTRALYGSAVFSSAFLLFLIEPIAAKQLLPALGGSSTVWLTCLVFFQLMLLGGYLYAHWLTRISPPISPEASSSTTLPSKIHQVLLTVAALLTLTQLGSRPNLTYAAQRPVAAIFLDLALTIGLPFLLLASTSPLLQLWFARRESKPVPYALFGLSNAGSLLALLLYPIVVEPNLTLHHQLLGWSIGFIAVAILHAIIARHNPTAPQVRPTAEPATETPKPAPGPPAKSRQKWLWFILPMVAAMQLSAVTGHLSQNVAAVPLLWILPLATYLLTFIAAFDAPRLYPRGLVLRLLVVMLAALGYMLTKTDMSLPIVISIAFFLVELFFAGYFLHAETYALRPTNTSEVTLFYLLIAAGGVAGSFFIGVASPLLFNANYDIAISFAATAAAALIAIWNGNASDSASKIESALQAWPQRFLWITATTLMCGLVILMYRSFHHDSIVMIRNFYGSLRVRESHYPPQALTVRTLQNGAVQHGNQWFAPEFRTAPTTYYSRDSGVGLALRNCCSSESEAKSESKPEKPRPKAVGIIGLGAGTLAAYGRPGDRFTFYEINPAVEPIARNLFTYIRESPAQVNILEGDARITLQNQPPQNYDVLVIDAFSGDAVPLHLLTREAIALYRHHLAPGGVLAFHVSNQYLDLAPEVALLAASQGMEAVLVQSPPDDERGILSATWILVTSNRAFLAQPEIAKAARPIAPPQNQPSSLGPLRPWTDDYSSLLPILRWRLH